MTGGNKCQVCWTTLELNLKMLRQSWESRVQRRTIKDTVKFLVLKLVFHAHG